MAKILEGIRVVELGTHVAVPKATRMMADWGAEVIKVEPLKGEAWRMVGPGYEMPAKPDNNPIFQVENMNKKSVGVSLKTEEGAKIMHDLIGTADVFITNTRYRSLEKLGLGYESLKEEFPKLIYVHFSAFGHTGPERDLPGFDLASFWAKSGTMLEWILAEDKPFKPQPGFADSTCASITLSGVLAALLKREKTGKGDFIQTSLYGSALWYNSIGMLCGQPRYHIDFPKKIYTDPLCAPYKSKDGDWIMVSSPDWDHFYAQVFPIIGLGDLVGDPMVSTRAAARENYDKVCAVIAEAFARYETKYLMDEFAKNGIMRSRLLSSNELYNDEQAWANDFITKVNLENGDELVVPRVPVRFESEEHPQLHLAPALGSDTDSVLTQLGYKGKDIETFRANGSVR